MSRPITVSMALVCLALSAGCHLGPSRQEARCCGVDQRSQPAVRSNILRADYAGSRACEACHAEIYRHWMSSPMHRMTRDATPAEVQAPFDGSVFEFMGDTLTLEQQAGRRFMVLDSRLEGRAIFRVTRVLGGRYREDFVGVETTGMRPESPARSDEMVLPVSFLLFNRSWRYKGYSVMTPERPGMRRGATWARTCIFCHNTVPHFSTLYDDILGGSAAPYQGAASVLLPDSRRFKYEISDPTALERALGGEMRSLGASWVPSKSVAQQLEEAVAVTRRKFRPSNLLELGIGCEACHGGAAEHVRDSRTHPTFTLQSDFLKVEAPKGSVPNSAEDINRTCAKCHTVVFSRYPYTWEGGRRDREPGGSSINSGEARDFLLGGCATELACTRCHDPHAEDASDRMETLQSLAGNRTCTACHQSFGNDTALQMHTHHQPTSEGSICMNCHMPKKNMGLNYAMTRYHRIGSPTDKVRVELDRPLECALCHVDRTVDQIVNTMEKFWQKKYDRGALERLYGRDLRVNALQATLAHGKDHEKAVAVSVAGEHQQRELLPAIVLELENRYPLVRFFAQHAIERITGKKLPLNMHLPGSSLVAQARAALSGDGGEGNRHAPD